MPYYALDYLPYQYLRKARRGRSGRSAVLGQAVKSAGIRNGNVALFSKIRQCGWAYPSKTIYIQHLTMKRVSYSPEATATQHLIWKQGVPKRSILKNLVSHVLNLKSWIKLVCDKINTPTVSQMSLTNFWDSKHGKRGFSKCLIWKRLVSKRERG